MTIPEIYNTLSNMYEEGSKANGDRFSVMFDTRKIIDLNDEIQDLADEVSKPIREGRDGAPSREAYHFLHELGSLLDAMREKYNL